MVSLRVAVPEDAPAMERIHRAALEGGAARAYSDRQLAALIADGERTLTPDEMRNPDRVYVVAERGTSTEAGDETTGSGSEAVGSDGRSGGSDGQSAVVGWGGVDLSDGVLAATFVHPDAAREGIGRRLAERLKAAAREANVATLSVYASRNAVGFYRALGFSERGTVDIGGGEGPSIPSVLMETEL